MAMAEGDGPSQTDALRARVASLQSEVCRLTSVADEVNEIKGNAKELVRRLAEQGGENQRLRSELDDLQENYDILFDEMEEANGAREEAEGKLEAANARAEELSAAAEGRSETNGKLRSDLDQMTKERDRALRRTSELEGEVDAARRDVAEAEAAMQAREREAQQRTEGCESALASEVERRERLELDLEQAKSDAQESRAAAEKESEASRKLRADLERRVSDLEGEAELLRRESSDAEAAMRDKQREVRREIEECKSIMAEEGELRREVGRLSAQLEECQSAAEDESKLRGSLQSEFEGACRQRDEALRRIQEKADAEVATQGKVQEMEHRMEESKAALNNEVENSRELRQEVDRLTAELEESKAAADDGSESALRRVSDLESEVDRLREEKSEAVAEIELLRDGLADADAAARGKEGEARRQAEEYETVLNKEMEKREKMRREAERARARAEELGAEMEAQSELNWTLRSDLAGAAGERDEALRRIADLERRIDLLTRDADDTGAAMRGGVQEAQRQTGETETASKNRAENSGEPRAESDPSDAEAEERGTPANGESPSRRALRSDLEAMASEKDVATRRASDLESEVDLLRREMTHAETAMRDKEEEARRQMEGFKMTMSNEVEWNETLRAELERAHSRAEEYKTAAGDQYERNSALERDLERAAGGRDEALRQIELLRQEMAVAKAVIRDKDQEMRQLLEEYKPAAAGNGAERSGGSHPEAGRTENQLKAQSELNSRLRPDLDRSAGSFDEWLRSNSDSKGEVDRPSDEDRESRRLFSRTGGYKETKDKEAENGGMPRSEAERAASANDDEQPIGDLDLDGPDHIVAASDRPLGDASVAEENVEAVVEDENREPKRPGAPMDECKAGSNDASVTNLRLQLNLDLVTRERELAKRFDKLSQHCRHLLAAKSDADAMMQDKDRESRRLTAQIDAKADLNSTLQLELEQMTSERNQLRREVDIIDAKAKEEMKDKDRELQQLENRIRERFNAGTDNRVLNGIEETSNPSDLDTRKGQEPVGSRSVRSDEDGGFHHSNGPCSSVGQTQIKTVSVTPDGSSHRQTNGRRKSIFSRFGSRRSAEGSDAKSQASSEGPVHELDQTKDDVITSPYAELADRIKALMEEIRVPERGNAVDNISALRSNISNLADEKDRRSAEVATLRATTEDLESTLSLQAMQNETLKEELMRLRGTINDMEIHKSSLEDNVEELKAKVLKLELMSQLREEAERSTKEARKTEAERRKLFPISGLFRG